ncbi:hypothetical protein [Cystobacter ferrugineus]|uniref:Uncharacterized protein n=1 Tax=Cystobacter ferrugineus TaxID=83449 RepID=A0A1L9BJR0_9BACT|nr:hypothetical protein [Cystobacter ferrugineus]OJH42510.1 hypothetical protein BON30_04770 [Cystobacter ferrugineus]
MANDVKITVINDTSEDTYGLVFQQDPSLDKIFVDVFPTAWQVFPLSKKTPGSKFGGRGTAILPIQYELGGGDTNDAFTGTVSVAKYADTKSKWELLKPSGFYALENLGTAGDNSIICLNNSGSYASMSLIKNSKPLLTYPKVGALAQATFLPINYIYVAWYTSLVEGSQIKASISTPQAVGINLDGANDVEATLTMNPNTGERKWSIKVNSQPVNTVATPRGRHQPHSITERVAG